MTGSDNSTRENEIDNETGQEKEEKKAGPESLIFTSSDRNKENVSGKKSRGLKRENNTLNRKSSRRKLVRKKSSRYKQTVIQAGRRNSVQKRLIIRTNQKRRIEQFLRSSGVVKHKTAVRDTNGRPVRQFDQQKKHHNAHRRKNKHEEQEQRSFGRTDSKTSIRQPERKISTQSIRQKQDRRRSLKKEAGLKYEGYVSDVKKNAVNARKTSSSANTNKSLTQTTKSQRRKHTYSSAGKNGQKTQNHTRQTGRKSAYGTRNFKQKIDRSLKKNVTPKNRVRSQIKEMLLENVGRDGEGNLNLIGLIIALVILVPVLLKLLIIIIIVAIIMTVIAVVIAIFSFIASLFVIKTEDMAFEQAYRYVTFLDAQKNQNVYEGYQKLVSEGEYDEVYFHVNGVQADPETFMYSSNGDSYLYYLNAKFEDYDIDGISIAKYRERVAAKTGHWIPWSSRNSIYAVFPEAPHPLTKEPIKINRVRDEIHAIHDMVYSYNLEVERDKVIETTKVTIDSETGEEHRETTREVKDIATLNIEIQTLGEMLDADPEVEVYTGNIFGDVVNPFGRVAAFDDEEVDKYYPISDLERFENKIFLLNPFGASNYASVIENYGYRGRNPSLKHEDIVLEAEPGTPVYAMGEERIDYMLGMPGSENSGLRTWVSINETYFYIHYRNIDLAPGLQGRRLTAGQLIGHTRGDGNLRIEMEEYRFWHADPPLYPAGYITNLTFAHETNIGYFQSGGGLRGELINPPASVTKWREKVAEETEKNGIKGYENAILSIIWVESGGNEQAFPDIMQASESQGLAPNAIKTPEESIEVGVRYFAHLLKKAQENQKSERSAVQAYNYGEAYLDNLIQSNVDYTFDHSRVYARARSDGKTIPYNNPVASTLGYNWRYAYGNMFYTHLVTGNIFVDSGRMVEVAKEEIGTLTGEKYWRWLGFENRMEWSAAFVSWVADQAGYIDQGRVLKTANVLNMIDWFKENDKFKGTNEDYLPQAGDIIFFDWSGDRTGKDHVGIVEYAGGNVVQVIEGNSSHRVRRRTYALDNISISGYGIP